MDDSNHTNTPAQVDGKKGRSHFQKYIILYIGLLYLWVVFGKSLVGGFFGWLTFSLIFLLPWPLVIISVIIYLLGKKRNEISGYTYGRFMNATVIILLISGFTWGLSMVDITDMYDPPSVLINRLGISEQTSHIIAGISLAIVVVSLISLIVGSIMGGRKSATNIEGRPIAKDYSITNTDHQTLYGLGLAATIIGVSMLFTGVSSWILAALSGSISLTAGLLNAAVGAITGALFATLGTLLINKKRAARPLAIISAVLLTISGSIGPIIFLVLANFNIYPAGQTDGYNDLLSSISLNRLLLIAVAWLAAWYISKSKILDTPPAPKEPLLSQ